MKILIGVILLFLTNISYSQGVSHINDKPMQSITLEGNYTRFLSDYKQVFPNSIGAYVNYAMDFRSGFSLHVRTGYKNLNSSDSFSSSTSTILPIHFGGRYYLTNSNFRPYASFMNGANIIIEDIPDTTVLGDPVSGTRVRYAWQVGVGIRTMISGNIFFDVNTNFNNSFYQVNAMQTGFEYNAGFGLILK